MDSKNYSVYWFHLPDQTDVFTEGYVGITNNIVRRFNEHFNNARKNKHTHLYHAINKYGKDNIICDIIHTNLSKKEAEELEEAYRPTDLIGWNGCKGGFVPYGKTPKIITYFHISNPDYEYCTTLQEAEKITQTSNNNIRMMLHRKNNTYNQQGWHFIHENTDKTTIQTINQLRSKLLSNKQYNKPSHFKGITNRWTEEQKKQIGLAHKGKKISEEQKRIVGEKNSKNPSLCTEITLKHKNSEKLYVFHSISEASRQLNIPLSRLKSKHQRPLGRYGKDGWAIIASTANKQ